MKIDATARGEGEEVEGSAPHPHPHPHQVVKREKVAKTVPWRERLRQARIRLGRGGA